MDVNVLDVHAKVLERVLRFYLPEPYKLPWNTNEANSKAEQVSYEASSTGKRSYGLLYNLNLVT